LIEVGEGAGRLVIFGDYLKHTVSDGTVETEK